MESKRLPKFIILEGPAGAGKTFLMDSANNLGITADPYQFGAIRRPRSYPEGLGGILLAQAKDAMKTLGFLVNRDLDVPTLTDRWLLSSVIYQYLRGETALPSQQDLLSLIRASATSMYHQLDELIHRAQDPMVNPHKYGIDIAWIFLLPTERYITTRRRQANQGKNKRSYPFRVKDELTAYQDLYDVATSGRMVEKIPQLPWYDLDVSISFYQLNPRSTSTRAGSHLWAQFSEIINTISEVG